MKLTQRSRSGMGFVIISLLAFLWIGVYAANGVDELSKLSKRPIITDETAPLPYDYKPQKTDVRTVQGLFKHIKFSPGADRWYFVQFTDLHPHYGVEGLKPVEKILRAIEEVNAMEPRPAFLVVTGDMTNEGGEKEIRDVKGLMSRLEATIPVHYVLGNHDSDVELYHKILGYPLPPSYSFGVGKWHFTVPFVKFEYLGEEKGYSVAMTQDSYEWFKEDIKRNSERPTMVLSHYNLVTTRLHQEPYPLYRAQVFSMIRQYGNIKWILAGHWHDNYQVRIWYEGLPLLNSMTTSTLSSFCIQGTCQEPCQGYRLICIDGDRVVATAFKPLGFRATIALANPQLRCPEPGSNAVRDTFEIDPPPEEWPIYAPPPITAAHREEVSDTRRVIILKDAIVKFLGWCQGGEVLWQEEG